jgi:hypothetical protein
MASVLEGVRVIDFGQYIAGPLAGMLWPIKGLMSSASIRPADRCGRLRPMPPGTVANGASF